MKKNNIYRFNQEELYALILQNKKKFSLSNIKTRLKIIKKKSPITKGLYPTAPYRVTFGLVQSMMEVESQSINDEGIHDLYETVTLKKMALIFVDALSICGVGYSPLWLLAILAEVTEGSQEYIELIQEELTKHGLLEAEENYTSIIDLLESFYEKAYIDKKLYSFQAIGMLKDDMIKLASYDKSKLITIQTKLEKIWAKMHKIGKYENFSINKMNGIISFDVMRQLKNIGIPATEATLITLIDHFDPVIYDTMIESMSEFTTIGKKYYLISNINPFIKYYGKEK